MKSPQDRDDGFTYHHYTDVLNRSVTLVRSQGVLESVVISLFKERMMLGPTALNLAVLGDLHGHVSPALQRLQEWKEFCGYSPDAILQVGDIGAINFALPDRTTRRMVRKDLGQLGFLDYLLRSGEAEKYFGEEGVFRNVPFYFVEGNHDDLEVINSTNFNPYPNIVHLKPEKPVILTKSGCRVVVSGSGYYSSPKRIPGRKTDVYLTHTCGSPESDEGDVDYKYHLFGHHRFAVQLSDPSRNHYGLNDVKIKRNRLSPGSIGWLTFNRMGESLFFYLPEQI